MTLKEHYENKKRDILLQIQYIREDLVRVERDIESDTFSNGGGLQNTHKVFRLLGELDILNELRTIEEAK